MTPLVLALTLAAGDPARFTTFARDGDPRAGQLLSWAADGRVALADPPAEFAPGEMYALRRAGRPLPPWPRTPQLVLANGDRLAAELRGGKGAGVVVRPATGSEGADWAVSLSAVAALWLAPPGDAPPDPAKYPWRPAGAKGDVVLLANGDTVVGTVDGVSADGSGFRLAAEGGKPPRTLPAASVSAIAFDPTLARLRVPKGPHYRLVFADGTRLTAATLSTEQGVFVGTNLFGERFRMPFAQVMAVDVVRGKATPMSDLKPTRAAVEGFAGAGEPWAADRTVRGWPLRLAGPDGGVFDKGVGTHPRTTLTYALGGKYRRFEAVVGLDPVTGRRGAAVARVLVDGKPATVPGLESLSAAELPVAVRADVKGAKELTLVVDFGPSGGVQADVNWADARLVE
jgi:hypothetical protein